MDHKSDVLSFETGVPGRAATYGEHRETSPSTISASGARAGMALPFVPRVARAQAYPLRPVRIVVGYPPGGPAGTDGLTSMTSGVSSVRAILSP